MKNNMLQVLVHHPDIAFAEVEVEYPGVKLTKVNKTDSPNYLFLDLLFSAEAKPGNIALTFSPPKGKKVKVDYPLLARSKPAKEYIGFNSSDAIYLITPDRFANANSANDQVKGLLEQEVDRSHDYKRHGGDIEGITSNLDYIKELGFTAVWPSPLLTNDMKQGSYHGYAITDYYQVDPRFGTLDEYKMLAAESSAKGMKLIMDQVANHCGLEHWWMKDLPFKDWVNFQKRFEAGKQPMYSNHRRTTNQDLYASKVDAKGMNEGWFVETMPDLNQRNPFLAKYIIQNSIWWIETLELGGIRQDTYPYPDKKFMANWAGAIMTEYPNFSIVGEEWSYNPLLISYWQKNSPVGGDYQSNLPSTMDFAMQSNIIKGIKEPESWNEGLVHLYEGLANDFAYAYPQKIMAFLDNHDKSRVFTEFDGDVANTKMALSYLLVLPRIPQIYYGTEIMMDDFDKPGDHGLIRTDFPGGWQGDTVSAFTGNGLSPEQKDMQAYLRKILNYRKSSKALQEGKTIHFAPVEGVYVLVRSNGEEKVIHIINKNETAYDLNLNRFEELMLSGKQLKNIITGDVTTWGDTMKLNKKGSTVLTTKL
ncbi:glycoside hydrolase family 13 protein [Gangjinia marincola]|uniref:Glycoside hydrolase family 13 protein n=2 Tax=Gangjinia marincola TaxID=578463 RepID=A0ABN1MGP8_9FLAO